MDRQDGSRARLQPDEPGYTQKAFPRTHGFSLIASADGREGSLRMHQDASLHRLILEVEQHETYALAAGRTAYLHVVAGEVSTSARILGRLPNYRHGNNVCRRAAAKS